MMKGVWQPRGGGKLWSRGLGREEGRQKPDQLLPKSVAARAHSVTGET